MLYGNMDTRILSIEFVHLKIKLLKKISYRFFYCLFNKSNDIKQLKTI